MSGYPHFALDGNAILFTTERYGMRAHASWGSLNDAMLVFLNQDAYDKYCLSKEDYELMEKYTYALFARGTEMAAEKGLILVDTKYEFGKKDGKVYLIDEIHTPDSSRYFYADGYQEKFEKGEPQKQLSKEFVRQWLIDHNFMGKEGQQVPEMTDEYVNSVSDRYIELYEHIVGQKFNKADNHDDLAARIEKNVTEYLNQK